MHIYEVFKGTPAETAGFKVGDIIVKANETEIANSSDFLKLLNHSKPKDKLQFTVLRNGEEKTIFIVLGARKE